jgi:hypothetical protein
MKDLFLTSLINNFGKSNFYKKNKFSNVNIGIQSGLSGFVLLYIYVFKDSKNFIPILENLLESLFTKIEHKTQSKSFCNGIAGFGWLIEVMNEKKIYSLNSNVILEDIDKELFDWAKSELKERKYDFMHSSLGVGLYFLKRLNSDSSKVKEIQYITNELIKNSVSIGDDKIGWIQSSNENFQKIDCFNLGLAHGIPSILVYLCKVYNCGILINELYLIIKKVTNFIISYYQDYNKLGFAFPNFISLDGKPSNYSRLGWCYGDLGVCCALWHSNNILKNEFLTEQIKNIISKSTERKDLKYNSITDTSICHGSAGLSHIYAIFHKRYSLECCKSASIYWLNVTHEINNKNYYNFKKKSFSFEDDLFDSDKLNMLNGISGVLSTFYHSQKEDNPFWNEIFLIS